MKNAVIHKRGTITFVLDRLTLAGRCSFGDSTPDEDDEFLDAGPLKIPEVAHIGGVRQNDRVGSFRLALQDEQSRDLHLSLSRTFLSLFPLLSVQKNNGKFDFTQGGICICNVLETVVVMTKRGKTFGSGLKR